MTSTTATARTLGDGWYTHTDESNNGASTATTAVDAEGKIAATASGYDSSKAFAISYKLDKGTYQYDPYVGWGVDISAIPNPAGSAASPTIIWAASIMCTSKHPT